MSGGVDSSVAAALLIEAGHEVTGATLKLWGGASDSGCCSVADVDDADAVGEVIDHPDLAAGAGRPFRAGIRLQRTRERVGRSPDDWGKHHGNREQDVPV